MSYRSFLRALVDQILADGILTQLELDLLHAAAQVDGLITRDGAELIDEVYQMAATGQVGLA